MKSRRAVLLLTFAALVLPAWSQQPAPAPQPGWQQLGAVTAVRELPNGIEFRAGQAAGRVAALSDSVIRVRIVPDGQFAADHSWAVVPEAAKSSAKVRIRNTADAVEVATANVVVRLDKRRARVSFLDTKGAVLQEDDPQRPMIFGREAFKLWKTMPDDEHYFGLGEKGGPLNHRNQAYTMWNTDAFGWQESTDPLYKSIPFYLALRNGVAHGTFLDNTYRTHFNFGREFRDSYSFGSEGGELDYYFVYGPHPRQVIETYTWLTGRTPLPPRWTLGYQQCRYSYFPEARVREIGRLFREKKIPIDSIYLDIDYQEGNRPFTIDRKLFPNFEDMIQDLGRQGYKMIAITDLHLKQEPGYRPYDEGMKRDLFVKNPDGSVYVGKVWPGDSVFPDFTLAEARHWWGTLYKEFVAMGLKGFWNDMNEPAIFERADKTMPLDTVHRVNGRKADHREIHNVFGMQNARATYEGLLRLQPDQRPFVLTRAAYAGTQRYAATWTGDNTSSWNHLRLMIPSLLNLGISGYANVGADIGGFAGSPPADLLTYWMAAGAFTPIYRNHTMKGSLDQEPWVHGPEHEAIRRRFIEVRYRLMPYLYTSFEETTRTGVPLMRPLFLQHPQEARLYGNDRQFYFGPDIMVAPRIHEMVDEYTIDLPKGDWYDYWTGERIRGKESIQVKFTLDSLPVFVRAGAILPHQPLVQHTDEVPQGPLQLRVYPGPQCAGSLYHDDGYTFAYKRGEFLRMSFTCQPTETGLAVSIAKPEGAYKPWWKAVQVEVEGVAREPRQVTLGSGARPEWRHDPQARRLFIVIPHAGAEQLRILY